MDAIGLVFAGGGGKGAYQIGVWRAVRELQLNSISQWWQELRSAR